MKTLRDLTKLLSLDPILTSKWVHWSDASVETWRRRAPFSLFSRDYL